MGYQRARLLCIEEVLLLFDFFLLVSVFMSELISL